MCTREKLIKQIKKNIFNISGKIEDRERKIDSITNKIIKKYTSQKFYKYRAINEHSLNNIKDNTIWLNTADEFNDVYDGLFSFTDEINIDNILSDMKTLLDAKGGNNLMMKNLGKSIPKDLEKTICEMYVALTTEIIQSNQKRTLVGSLSDRCDSIYMWGVYGNYGKGICIEYDYKDIQEAVEREKMGFYPVIYGKEYPETKNLFKAYLNKKQAFEKNYLALMKSEEWKQENEWRIIGVNEKEVGKNIKLKPSRIYFGPHTSEKDIEIVLEETKHQIECIKLEQSPTKFSLKIGECWNSINNSVKKTQKTPKEEI